MTVSKDFYTELEFNPEIKYDEAIKRFPTLSRSNFDRIKCEWRKEQREKEKKDTTKNKKKTKKKSHKNSTGKKITQDQLKGMSIKAKLKMVGESVVDDFLLTGTETRILTKAIDLLSRDDFIEQGEIVHNIYWTSDTPPYKPPEFLYEHQKTAMLLMDLGHLLWYASRQLAGKTTAALLKDFEDMLYNDDYVIGFVSPSVPLSSDLLSKFLYNPIRYNKKIYRFYDIIKPYLLNEPNQLGFRLKNGSQLKILSLKHASAQGRSLDVIHIEELDKLGNEQQKRMALAGIVNSVRNNPNAKIRICCNVPRGIFRLLAHELFKYGRYFNIFVEDVFLSTKTYTGRHTIINENVIMEELPTLDDILKTLSEVLVSYEFAEGQLYNIDSPTDDTFNPDKIAIAYDKEYDQEDYYIRTTMGIDPAGQIDAFGVSIWSLTKNGNTVLRWCKRYYNAVHEAKQQAKEIAEEYIRYNCEDSESESSAGAGWSLSLIGDEVAKLSNNKIRFKFQYINFQGKGKPLDKDNFVMLFKILLDYEKVILKDTNDEERALHRQITLYIPNKSESNNNPDDLIESSFHALWILLGGMNYIKKLIDRQEAPIGATTQE